MRRILVAVPLVLAVATAAANAYVPPVRVPSFVQGLIVKRSPALAYVPARAGTGFRYSRFQATPSAVKLWFRNRYGVEIRFTATRLSGTCRADATKSFQLDGNKVWWAQRPGFQESWRCVGSVRLAASTTLPPTKFADSGLGIVAASGHRITR